MEKNKYWFFGSKLNTVLLLVLIILMIVALKWMHENKNVGFPLLGGHGAREWAKSENQAWDKYQTDFVNKLEGNKNDLVSFSTAPGQEVSGTTHVTGAVRGAYFFEANILLNILDSNKKILKAGHGTATEDWMTSGPVSFAADLDFTGLPKGKGYIEIRNDNASDLPENDKSILIPIVIK